MSPDAERRLNGDRRLRGANPEFVRRALADGNPLPGGDGFAGSLSPADQPPPGHSTCDGSLTPRDSTYDGPQTPGDSTCEGPQTPGDSTCDGPQTSGDSTCDGPVLVRDVLGRQPLFVDASATDPTDPGAWSFDRTDLADPLPHPPGTVTSRSTSNEVWTLPDPPAASPDDAQTAVTEAVTDAIDGIEPEGLAVAFSGGIDSALVATGAPDAPCYVAGFEGSHDVEAAVAAAESMARDLRVVKLSHADLERAVPEIVAATGRTNAMDISIALPLYLTAEAAAANGHDRLLLGQGADELFGGYSKVVDPASDHRVEADTVRQARRETMGTLPAQLERDVLALRAAGVEPVTPLLHDHVVAAALRLPADLLATRTERKVALRRAARGAVPERVRTADKKAVQYGTYVSRELDRLARRAGFKRRMDDHVGQYVEALVADAS